MELLQLLLITRRYKLIRSTKRGGNQSSAMKFDIGSVNAYNDNPQGIYLSLRGIYIIWAQGPSYVHITLI